MMNLSHEQARAYALRGRDDLNAAEQAALVEHLRACADCRVYADDIGVLQAAVRRTLQRRWDAVRLAAEVAPTISARLPGRKFPQQVFSFAAGLAALVALVVVLRAFFTLQLQLKTVQSPLITLPASTITVTPPALNTLVARTPVNDAAAIHPTPTLPGGTDFYRLQRLTYTPAGAFRPAVSPDGQRVAYASERNGNWDVYVLDRRTRIETRLTDDELPDMAPSWSPDGTRIAYQHNVPSADGPVLVDYMVMDANGSNKTSVFSGATWLKNEAPQWSPAGDRLAFSNGSEIVVAALSDRRDTLIVQSADRQTYACPVWFDNQHLLYLGDGQMMFTDLTGNGQAVLTLSDPVQVMMAASPYIAYVEQQDTTTRVSRTGLDEIPATTLAVFSASPIEQAALSPNGQLVAVQTDNEIVVVVADLPAVWQLAPLFRFSSNVTPSDLLSVAWLPDSSGFVFVSAHDGQPDLYLMQLNQPAIDYVKSLGRAATPRPERISPEPSLTSAPDMRPSPTPSPALSLPVSPTTTPWALPTSTSKPPKPPTATPAVLPSSTPTRYTPPTATPYIFPTATQYVPPTATPYVFPTSTPYTPPTATPYVFPTSTLYVPPTTTPYVFPTPTLYVPPASTPYVLPTATYCGSDC